MEGPSLKLAAEQLEPFVGKRVLSVSGNSKKEIQRLADETIHAIFSYGKQLFFQCDTFALRIHFLLFGSFEARVQGHLVTGDYPRKERSPRLYLEFDNGEISCFSCSVLFIESSSVFESCDFTIDIMSPSWNSKRAFSEALKCPEEEIADLLLDQTIFMGVGNIIKNESLFLEGISPLKQVKELSKPKLKRLIKTVREYVFQFYAWRKAFELKKHYQVYRQSTCKRCGTKVVRKKTGVRRRLSFTCPHCQPYEEKVQ